MKKLRFFDSLKFVRFVVAVVAATFILNVAHADTTAIQSVIAYGKTQQSGTPTPTNPAPIMTNNGVLKVSPNICTWNQSLTATGNGTQANLYSGLFTPSGYEFEQNTQYTISFDVVADNVTYSESGNLLYLIIGYTDGTTSYTGVTSNNYQDKRVVIKTAVGKTVSGIRVWNRTQRLTGGTITVSNMRIEEGSTATTGIYADGMVETILDSAGHTATAQMLLGLNDTYRDEQNINTGAITRKVGVTVLDGTENWITSTTYGADVFVANGFLPNSLRISANSGSILFSTHFAPAPISGAASTPKVNNTMSINSAYHAEGVVWIRSNNFSTVAQFKSWLAEQYANGTPVIVVYPLAESAQTTESVATQSLTTAPVRQTAGSILGMPIEVVLGDGTREWVRDMITIATTKYNEEQFEPVQNRLSDAMDAVDDVVTRTMTQAQQIDQIANEKQTRPDEGCPAKYCLLVEDEDGTPHWYPIAGANGVAHNLPNGYTELQYIEGTGTQYINTGITGFDTGNWEIYAKWMSTSATQRNYASIVSVYTDESTNTYRVIFSGTNGTAYLVAGNAKAANGNRLVSGAVDQIHEATIKNGSVVFDGTTYTTTSQGTTIPSNTQLRIFGISSSIAAAARIYSVKVTKDGVLRADYIPAKRDSDNALGLYDMVSGGFFANSGTGVFTGPEM